MANNVFAKPEKLAAAALGLLESSVLLANLVARDSGAEFTGARNDTVNIKRPSRLAGFEQDLRADNSGGIQSENLNEWTIPVTLDKHVYSAVDLTDAELTLDVTDFGAQVLMPQVSTVVRRVEKQVAAKLMTAPSIGTIPANDDLEPDDPDAILKWLTKARTALNKNDVPTAGRIAVVGSDMEAAILNSPLLVAVNTSGSSEVLREATVGRLRGFTIYVSNDVAPDAAICYHPSAYILVNRAPVVPVSAQGASRSYEGMSLRVLRDYNSHTASDRSFISTYTGMGEVVDAPEDATDPATEAKQLRAVSFSLAPGGSGAKGVTGKVGAKA
ncbi:P22 phage major capsid protein family protein [Microtetraspora malaysiensis]|uniref:P22 phage major capsid protein family protein n=1 Tax=Microtetraspora malaysiensis TaxID=161358 RepID=UPI003D8AC380